MKDKQPNLAKVEMSVEAVEGEGGGGGEGGGRERDGII